MKKEERAIIIVDPKYGFGQTETQQPLAVVPPGSTLTYELELVSFENAKETWEMDEGQKVERATELKQKGNELFKAGKNERALKKYTKAFKLVEHESSFKDGQRSDAAKALRKSCLLNQAAAQLRLKRHRDVVSTCTKIIDVDRTCVKALYRRAEAYIEMEEFLEANIDLKRALDVEPENRDVIVKLKRAKQLEAAANKKQAKLYGNMFARMAKLEEKERGDMAPEDSKKQAESDKADDADAAENEAPQAEATMAEAA
eukprot:scaffold198130_cov45-Prasinocladus_malaysianus.AAC.1